MNIQNCRKEGRAYKDLKLGSFNEAMSEGDIDLDNVEVII